MIKKPFRKDYFYGPVHLIVREDVMGDQYGITAWSVNRKWTVDLWLGRRFITLRRIDG